VTESIPQSGPTDLNLSPTVSDARRRLQGRDPVSAGALLVKTILERHSEYGRHKASSVALVEAPADQKRPVQERLEDIRSLFDISHAPELIGRLVILGLGMLDPELKEQLQKDGFLAALVQELKESLNTLLTAQGAALREPFDSVPNHPDNPLLEIN
jgi:hypothetical protein